MNDIHKILEDKENEFDKEFIDKHHNRNWWAMEVSGDPNPVRAFLRDAQIDFAIAVLEELYRKGLMHEARAARAEVGSEFSFELLDDLLKDIGYQKEQLKSLKISESSAEDRITTGDE